MKEMSHSSQLSIRKREILITQRSFEYQRMIFLGFRTNIELAGDLITRLSASLRYVLLGPITRIKLK